MEDLDINNVRASILNGGDLWWDLQNGGYQVPKAAPGTSGPMSLFSGAIWLGGVDNAGTIKVAAQTYRQTGNDFWPGPLSSTGSTDASTCLAWDKIFKINKQDVKNYINWFDQGSIGTNPVNASAMDVILNWPATGPDGQPMAPYYDANGNGVYDPYAGDYPDFWLGDGSRPAGQSTCDAELQGDQVLYWVFNDKGNAHTETGGPGIGMEIRAQAFAFQTDDEINDMTFYKYTMINKSSFRLDSTYFGVYVDSEIGSGSDDYVGCDVGLGLGYSFNGDMVDDNPPAGQIPYGINPPAIGLDFFEGPLADPNGVDDSPSTRPASYVNYGDGIVDNEHLGMSKFISYTNDFTAVGIPSGDLGVYLRMKGHWTDNTQMTYGGIGHLTGVPCDYMFPGISDPLGFGTGGSPQGLWDEASIGNVPNGRVFLQTVGPFTLQPGAVNEVTTGLVWAKANYGGPAASVALMKGADAKAQDLFNNCFALLSGPDAPDLSIQELENELILTWTNPITSNNYNENYSEDYDKSTNVDSAYRFQGYILYQLRDETVTIADLYNVDKARLVLQCDRMDTVAGILNYTHDSYLQAMIPQEMVNGADKGIVHSVSVTEDKFAVGNPKLVNHKTYYYAIVAYAYSPTKAKPNYAIPKDYKPFIRSSGLSNTFIHSAIPHIPNPESNGTVQHSIYGMGPELTRIEGHGNGGNILDLTPATVSEILNSSSSRAVNPTYENSRGPVIIKVVDPLSVPVANNFEFKLKAKYPSSGVNISVPQDSSVWELINLTTGDTVFSERTIAIANEQIINGQPTSDPASVIPAWGLSVNVSYTTDPGINTAEKNSFLEGTMAFTDNTKQWLSGLQDQEGQTNDNWIRSGTIVGIPPFDDATGPGTDPEQHYENIINKTWAPYRVTATGINAAITSTSVYAKGAPAWPVNITLNKISNLASVDVVITSDKSLWTRCPVLEEQDDATLSEGAAKKLNMRVHGSVDKNGISNFPSADNNDFSTGMGWFPGYAINLETGERLNMAFGEDSWLTTQNGNDMKWNPTTVKYAVNGDPVYGGKHYIYIFGHNGDAAFSGTDAYLPGGLRDVPRYDKGYALHKLFAACETATGSTGDSYKREAFTDAMWVNIPLLVEGHVLMETSVKIRLRVAKSYQKGYTSTYSNPPSNSIFSNDNAATPQNNNFPMYTFNTTEIETNTNNADAAVSALELINIVPNPYYAYSAYERKALENIVKITNLPVKCDICIYTLSGTLIRRFSKNDAKTSLDWDLKNMTEKSIASGMYIIYIKVPDIGEKTLKWFGVLRPLDLDSY